MKKTKVYFLDLGGCWTDMNLLIHNYTLGVKSNPTPAAVWDWFPVTAVLIDHPEGKILYDTGFDPAAETDWPAGVLELNPPFQSPEQTLVNQLALCGTKPEEIDKVVLSHLHLDHAGCLDLFKDKEIIVNEIEFKDAMAFIHEELDQTNHFLYLRKDLNIPVKKYTLVNGDYEVAKGVKMLHLPGHTPGMCGLQIDLEDTGTMILTRDLCYTATNYGPPAHPSGLVKNLAEYTASIERVRALAAETNAMVVFGHDQEQFRSMKRAPEYYE